MIIYVYIHFFVYVTIRIYEIICKQSESPNLIILDALYSSARGEDVLINSELIEGKSPILESIFDCERKSGKTILKIEAEEEIPFKSLLYFLHHDKLEKEIPRSPCDIFGLLLIADKFCAISCIKECSRVLRESEMTEEVAFLYLDPWSILMVNDDVNYTMIKSAKNFFMNKYKDFDRFPDDLKARLSKLNEFILNKFNEIQRAPEKISLSLAEAIFKSNTIEVDSEDQIYDVVLIWSKIHFPNEQQWITFLSENFDILVRFAFMSREKLSEAKNYWKSHPIISNKIRQGFVYHSRSSAGTHSRFLNYNKKKSTGNEAVLEAIARRPYEQIKLNILGVEEENAERFKERAYRKRPIRILSNNDHYFASCCVYLEFKRDHCSKILADGKCISQVFYPFAKGVQGFFLSAQCIDQEDGFPTFGLFLERHEEGPEAMEFDCSFHVFSKEKDISDYSLRFETRYKGQPVGCPDLMPWTALMDLNSPFFLGGILYIRIDLFQSRCKDN